MQRLLLARYYQPLYSSEPDCIEPYVEQESIIGSFTIKIEADPEPSVIVKPDVLEELESEVITELVPLQEETFSAHKGGRASY